jgi:Sec-independent protein translocase protein TatA
MFKKFAKFIVVLSATSLVLVQTEQSAQASFLDDLSDFLKGAEIGAELGEGLDRATRSDGSVDVRQIIRSTQRAVGQIKEATSDSPEPQRYQRDTESDPSEVQQVEESVVEQDSPEVQQSESEPDISEESASEDGPEPINPEDRI